MFKLFNRLFPFRPKTFKATTDSRFIVAYVPWYSPVKLAARTENGFEFVGWLSGREASLVRNNYEGWIAFVDDQTPEKLRKCPTCKRPFEETTDESRSNSAIAGEG